MRLLLLCAFTVVMSSPLVAQRAKRGCPEISVDSVQAGEPVYLACQVDREAKPRGIAPRIDWSPSPSELRDGSCFRAEYQFVVDTLGIPDVRTVRDVGSTTSSFQQAARDAIPRLRYSPALRNGTPVRQLVSHTQSAAIRRVITSSPAGSPPSTRPPRC
ncbi:MAG: hypothetical protein Q8K82_09545 [Gemmatimonadaceae bacterium]|nr:hypothetical protein [Gemmatimonadaceae bacterium]